MYYTFFNILLCITLCPNLVLLSLYIFFATLYAHLLVNFIAASWSQPSHPSQLVWV